MFRRKFIIITLALGIAGITGIGLLVASSGSGSSPGATANADDLTRGLVGYWKFDEGTGQTVGDSSGNGNNGTLGTNNSVGTDDPKWTIVNKTDLPAEAVGVGNRALDFDGANDYVDVANTSSLNFQDEVTLAAWVNVDAAAGGEAVFVHKYRSNSHSNYGLLADVRDSDRHLIFFASNCSSSGGALDSPIGVFTKGKWEHVAVTFVDSTDTVRFYVNGVDVGGSTSYTRTPCSTFTGNVEIGGWSDNGNDLDGKIDEVRIYNRALSAAEIRFLYNRGGPIAHWRFDEGSGTTAFDAAGSGDGTLTNMTDADWVQGKFGTALNFDGTDDFVTAADQDIFDLTNEGTFQAWMKFDFASSTESNFLSWTTVAAPDGAGAFDPNDGVDITVVGNTIYYAAYLHDDATEIFRTATSSLDGTVFSGWSTTTAPNGAGNSETTSIAIDSDGNLLYYAAFTHNNDVEAFYTATSTLSGAGISWRDQPDPDGAGAGEGNTIDMTIVDGKMYFAVFLNDSGVETFYTANSNLDGTGFSGWTSQPAIDGARNAEAVSVAIDSDGEKLYYAAFAYFNETEVFSLASSALGGTAFSGWTSKAHPNDTNAGHSFIDMTVVGDKLYFAAFLHNVGTSVFSTAKSNLDGSDFDGWFTREDPGGAGEFESTSPAITTDGKNLYYSAFAHNGATETFKITRSTVTNHPIISKADAYELIHTGGGFIFDWAGSPKSFGSMEAGKYALVTLTHDGTTMKYYINDELQREQAVTTDFSTNSNPLRIGGDSSYFDGIIDEVRIFNYPRTIEQIRLDMNAGLAARFGGTPDLERGLVGHWTFDELSGQTANDSSGSSNNGTLGANSSAGTDDPKWTTAPARQGLSGGGGALDFDGADDFVDIVSDSSLNPSAEVTVAAWVNLASCSTSDIAFVSKSDGVIDSTGTSLRYALWSEGDSTSCSDADLDFCVNNGGEDESTCVHESDSMSSENTWGHYVGTYDGSTLKIYHDAVLQASKSLAVSLTGGSGDDVRIGSNGIGSDLIDGKIDDVRIYNRALTAEEIRYLYNNNGPTAHWKFDEGSGTTAFDSVASGHGTLTNMDASTDWVQGKYGTALDFNGTNEYVDASAFGDYSYDDFTFSVWYKSHGPLPDDGTIFFHQEGGGTPDTIGFHVTDDSAGPDTVRLQIEDDGSSTKYYGTSDVVDQQWHHLSAVRTSTRIKMYVDGVLESDTADIDAGQTIKVVSSTTGPTIGDEPADSEEVVGLLDDLKFYNYARTAEEVRLDYNAGLAAKFGGTPDLERGLVGLWTFDELAGQTVSDRTINGNDGTLGTNSSVGSDDPKWSRAPARQGLSGGGGALDFDGADDYVSMETRVCDQVPCSVSGWFKTDALDASRRGVFRTNESGNHAGIGVYISNTGQLLVRLGDGTGNDGNDRRDFDTAAGTVAVDEWYHFAVVAESITQVTVYVNGTSRSISTSGTGNPYGAGTGVANIGRAFRDAGNQFVYMDGLIDDIRVYDRLLTAEEIRYLYNNNGPVAHWRFDEGSGSTAFDSMGSNDGTLEASMTDDDWVQGKYGTALDFDGSNDYVEAPNSNSLNITGNEITISTWIFPHVQSSDHQIVNKRDASTGYSLEYDAVNIKLNLRGIGTGLISHDFNLNQWQHFSATYDGDIVRFYIDGVLQGISDISNSNLSSNTGVLRIGVRQDTGAEPYNGLIDDVRIYNYARSPSEILQDYNAGLGTHFR